MCSSGSQRLYFTYDADGRRTKIVTAGGGSSIVTELRYADGRISAEYVHTCDLNGCGSPVLTREYVTDESGAVVKLIIPSGQPNAGTYLVSYNGHGDALNLVQVAKGSATLANSFTYDTWGAATVSTHNGIGDLGFRFRYVGQLTHRLFVAGRAISQSVNRQYYESIVTGYATVTIGDGEASLALLNLPEAQLQSAVPTYRAQIHSSWMTAGVAVGIEPWEDPRSLASFFEELAADWRGWDGMRVWHSGDGSLSLVCSHDRIRRVDIDVVMTWNLWRASGKISVPPGELSDLAAKLRQFLDSLAMR